MFDQIKDFREIAFKYKKCSLEHPIITEQAIKSYKECVFIFSMLGLKVIDAFKKSSIFALLIAIDAIARICMRWALL